MVLRSRNHSTSAACGGPNHWEEAHWKDHQMDLRALRRGLEPTVKGPRLAKMRIVLHRDQK